MAESISTAPSTPCPEPLLKSEIITVNISFKLPKSIIPNLENWLFDYFTNFHVNKVVKNSENDFTVSARIQDKLISVPQTLEDNMKIREFTQMMQKELVLTNTFQAP